MKRLSKHLSIYGLGGILTNSISYFLLPVYTRVLSPEEYGSLTLVTLVGSVLAIFCGLMIASGFSRIYFDTQSHQERKLLFASAFWFTLINAGITFLLVAVAANDLAAMLFQFPGGALYIRLIAASTALFSVSALFYGLLMVTEKSRVYVSVNIFSLIVILSLTILFVVVLDYSVKGIFFAQVVGRGAEFLMLIILRLRREHFSFSGRLLRPMLEFSLPLVPSQLFYLIMILADRFFLQNYRTLTEVGLYSLGYKFAAVLPILIVQPLKAWTPYIFALAGKEQECKATIARFLRYYFAVALILVLTVSVFSPEILLLMAKPQFHSAWKVVYLLSLGALLFGVMNLIVYGIHIAKKTWIVSFVFGGGCLVNVILNYFLVPRYGISGAAVASLASYLVIVVGYFLALQRIYPIRFEYFKLIAALLAATVIYYLSTLQIPGLTVSIFSKLGLIVMFPLLLFFSGYFTSTERNQLIAFIIRTKT